MKLKPSLVNKLNRLICTGRWMAGDAVTFAFAREDVETTVRFKQDAVDLLLDLGTPFADLRSEVSCIRVNKTESAWDLNREGLPAGRAIIEVVDPQSIRRIVRLLIKALRRLNSDQGTLEKTGSRPISKQIAPKKSNGSYSAADDKVFRLIGAKTFQTHTNAELFQRYRSQSKKWLDREINVEVFRAICNRIRRHHGLSTSAKIKKTVKVL